MSCKYGYCWEWISIQSRIYLPGEGIWDILQVSCLNRLANKITWYIQSSTQPWLVTLEEARIPVNLISWVKHRPRQKIILQNNKGSILGEVSGLIRLYKKNWKYWEHSQEPSLKLLRNKTHVIESCGKSFRVRY